MPKLFLVCVVLGLAALACGPLGARPAATSAAPAEALLDFDCYGRSSDLFAAAFSLRPGGTANFNGQEGTWAYDGGSQVFSFSPALSVESARFDAGTGELEVDLRPGLTLPNAPDGLLACRAR